jgi:hypothetical protein
MVPTTPRFPVHRVCRVNVPQPRISVLQECDREVVVVQWFGEVSGEQLGDHQFAFELSLPMSDIRWFGYPERFRVAYIGPVEDWPNREGAEEFLRGVQAGTWVIWVVSSMYTLSTPAGPRCGSLVSGLVRLADPNLGVINPLRFWDEKVPAEEQARAVE